MAFKAGNAAITNTQNVGLTTRNRELAVAIETNCDGSQFSQDGVLQRGTIMVPSTTAGLWRPFVRGTDTLAADQVRIMTDDVKVNQGQNFNGAGYSEGFFRLSSLIDANAGLQASDLIPAAGFHPAGNDEIRLK